MARTELLSRLQQLYRDFRAAEVSGTTVHAIDDARRATRVTRRDFLKTAGGAATAAAAFGTRAAAAGSQPRIAIIGGGIAGLNAALTLQDAGYGCRIYEASSRIGGRMHSDTTSWANGQVTEHCGELIDSTHKTILSLAKRFKIAVDDVGGAEPRQSSDTYFFGGQYYPRSQAIDDFAPVYHAVKKDSNDAGYPTLYNNYNPAGMDLDNLSIYDWIETRVPGGHSASMGKLLDVAYNIEYGGETAEQSALNLVYLLAYQPSPGNFRIFGRSDERYHLHGGNEGLPRAIAESLTAGTIETGAALRSILQNSDGSYQLEFNRGPSRFSVTADRVILTIPFSVLRQLDYDRAGFSSLKSTAIQQLGYGTNAKLHLQFSERLWNQSGPWGIGSGGSFSDNGYQNTWDVTRAQQGPTGILVNYTGGNVGAAFSNDGKPATIQSYALQFLSQIQPVFPGLATRWNGRATLDTPVSSPYLLGSYSYWKRGQYTAFAGVERERSGRCHFAGEHCSVDFQGYMEGGASEGARAAGEILADYKKGILP
ncbi:MAG TPA: NAD(P)/FAD-dependent oxidoreductase [Terriglobia bacterium]|nr:NAD(P)/FAD-dependent oxidoreductase [Terriglobia bacterium]